MEKSEEKTTTTILNIARKKELTCTEAQLLERLLRSETEHAFAQSAPFYDGWRVKERSDQQ